MVNRRIISLISAAAVLLSCVTGLSAAAAENTYTDADKKAEMLMAFSILPNDGKSYDETVKRDEFAYYISCLMRKSTEEAEQGSSDSAGQADKYTGYTNDVKREEWVWDGEKTESKASETVIESTNTPFYDLRNTDEYYSSIEYVYNMGVMRGSDGYFRPKERLTGYEMLKVMVTLLGGGRYSGGDFPAGYLAAAEKTGLLKELKIGDLNAFVTYEKYVLSLDALLKSNAFKFRNGNFSELVISDKSFREDFLGIYKTRGVMTTNGVATVSVKQEAEEGYVSVDGMYLKDKTGMYESLLGYDVDAYYTDDDETEIMYMCMSGSNREKLIDAEDIVSYSHPYYTYYEGNSTKKVYCGSDTTVMYNGFIDESYTEKDMMPKTGSVRLVDNNGDGKYELAFVTSYTTIWVSINDTVNNIIYDGLNKGSIKLDDYDKVIVRDTYSAAMDTDAIKRNAVLFVAPTKPARSDSSVTIIVSVNTAKGKVKSVTKDDVTLSDATYEFSAEAGTNDIKLGESYTFYLDPNGRIAAWEKETADELLYGYLAKIGRSEKGLDTTVTAKIYVLADDDFATYKFADKARINDKRLKEDELFNSEYLYDKTAGKPISQVIRYRVNADRRITELYTPDVVKDKLVTLYTAMNDSTSLVYRESPNAFMSQHPVFYGKKDTVWLYVPKTDANDTDSYYIKKYKHDDYIYLNAAYGSDENSLEASLIIKKIDSAKSKTVDSEGAAVLLIKDISNVSINEEIYKAISCYTPSGEREYYLEEDSGLADTSAYRVGDLIRVVANENTNKIKSIERVFDCDKMVLTNDTSLFGTNPKSSYSDMHFISATHVFHGVAEKKYNNGEILNVRLFDYTTDSNGNITKNGLKDEAFNVKASMYSVYIIDKERNKIYKTTADEAILTAESAPDGNGTELIASNFWGSPRAIFIYE